MRVFSSERTALFRSARFAFWMLRFFWLLMFATEIPSSEPDEATSEPFGSQAGTGEQGSRW